MNSSSHISVQAIYDAFHFSNPASRIQTPASLLSTNGSRLQSQEQTENAELGSVSLASNFPCHMAFFSLRLHANHKEAYR